MTDTDGQIDYNIWYDLDFEEIAAESNNPFIEIQMLWELDKLNSSEFSLVYSTLPSSKIFLEFNRNAKNSKIHGSIHMVFANFLKKIE